MNKLSIQIRIYCTFLFLIQLNMLNAQSRKDLSFRYFDSITYASYMAGNWDQLINDGKEAISLGYDYKYLRSRVGIAYFYKQKYRPAAIHFGKALEFDNTDVEISEYFNLSCNYGGRIGEQHQVKSQPKKNKFIKDVFTEFTYNSVVADEGSLPIDVSHPYTEVEKNKSLISNNIGMNMALLPNLNLTAAVSRIEVTREQKFQFNTTSLHRDSKVDTTYGYYYKYAYNNDLNIKVENPKTTQYSYYLQAAYYPIKGFKIVPAFHYLSIERDIIKATVDSLLKSDTAYFNHYDSTWHDFAYNDYGYQFVKENKKWNDYSFSLAVYKDIGNFKVGASAGVSQFNNLKFKQISLSVDWFPLGNTFFYTGVSVTQKIGRQTNDIVNQFKLGGKIWKYCWIESSYTMGKMINFSEANSFMIYNQPYAIINRVDITLLPQISKQINFYLNFKWFEAESNYVLYNKINNEYVGTVQHPQFKYINLTGGLQWKL